MARDLKKFVRGHGNRSRSGKEGILWEWGLPSYASLGVNGAFDQGKGTLIRAKFGGARTLPRLMRAVRGGSSGGSLGARTGEQLAVLRSLRVPLKE